MIPRLQRYTEWNEEPADWCLHGARGEFRDAKGVHTGEIEIEELWTGTEEVPMATVHLDNDDREHLCLDDFDCWRIIDP